MADEFEDIVANLNGVNDETECLFTLIPKPGLGDPFQFTMSIASPEVFFGHLTHSMASHPNEVFEVSDTRGKRHALPWRSVGHLVMEEENE